LEQKGQLAFQGSRKRLLKQCVFCRVGLHNRCIASYWFGKLVSKTISVSDDDSVTSQAQQ